MALQEGRNHLDRARFVPLVRPLLDDPDPEVLYSALLVLDHYELPVSEDRLRRYLSHEHHLVRRYAARIAGRVGLELTWPSGQTLVNSKPVVGRTYLRGGEALDLSGNQLETLDWDSLNELHELNKLFLDNNK